MAGIYHRAGATEKRFLNIPEILNAISGGTPGTVPRSLSSDLVRFAATLSDMEKFLFTQTPLKMAGYQIDRSQDDWQFIAYGRIRTDQEFVARVIEFYMAENSYLLSCGFHMPHPDDFAHSLIWQAVMSVWQREMEGAGRLAEIRSISNPIPDRRGK